MSAKFSLLLLAAALGLAQGQEQVSIQVYYESNCPDSIAWITTQLPEAYKALGKYLQIDFFPFGKADWEEEDDGGYSFSCQHGPNECYGNIFQACLLDKLDDNAVEVSAVVCIMGAVEPHYATDNCMDVLEITEPSYEEVAECQASDEGEELLYELGLVTKQVGNPPDGPEWVPWITINDVYIDDDFNDMQYDLKNHLCEKYLQDVPECQ